MSIAAPPDPLDPVRFKPGIGTRFILTVDAEEEFDWNKPIERAGHTVLTVTRLGKFQKFCEEEGVVPVYLVDYPIAASRAVLTILGDAIATGKAEIGLQMHPWVNPPFDEEVSEFNSFTGNLPYEVERGKFFHLKQMIETRFKISPLIFRAGRYGVGPNTAAILLEAGISIDSSVRPRFDYSSQSGPNFFDFPLQPYWLDRFGGLFEMPLTTVYSGLLRRIGPWFYPMMWRVPRLRGVLAHFGLLERIPLTPEGVTAHEAIRGIDIALADQLPLLVFSFHSPSLAPGYTPYVRSESDLEELYRWWQSVFAHLRRRGIAATTIREIIDSVELA